MSLKLKFVWIYGALQAISVSFMLGEDDALAAPPDGHPSASTPNSETATTVANPPTWPSRDTSDPNRSKSRVDPDGLEATSEEVQLNVREHTLMESNTLAGGVGLLHTQHAQSGAPGQFRLSILGKYYSGGFLCTAKYPCVDPLTSARLTSDRLSQLGVTFGLGATLARIATGALEVYGSISAVLSSDAASQPTLVQVFGDSNIAIRFVSPIATTIHGGAFAELQLVNSSGTLGLSEAATSGRFGLVTTIDLREVQGRVPVRISLNGAYSLDNRGQVVKAAEAALGGPISRIQRFDLGINRVDHVDLYAGMETFLVDERVRPFVEYGVMVPANRQAYRCNPDNASQDSCLSNVPVAPSQLTLGSRFFPWKRGFGLTAAVDVGLTGVKDFVEEMTPTLPWAVYIGGGWAFDTAWDNPAIGKAVQKPAVVKPPTFFTLTAFVHEKNQTVPIEDAILVVTNRPELTRLATGANGMAGLQGQAGDAFQFAVKAAGYKNGVCEGAIAKEQGRDVLIDCPLEAVPKFGAVAGRALDAETQAPINGASIRLHDANGKEVVVPVGADGEFRFEEVPPGLATVTATAVDYLSGGQQVDVKVRKDNAVGLTLRHVPKNSLVTVGNKEITIKQQIQFAVDSATILPQSYALMVEITDAILKNDRIKKIEIQGHTDNTGPAEHNKKLSERRADAVRAWLVAHGVGTDRLQSKGYGQDQPLVPNVTNAGKSKNRRVQFIILEQDAPPTPPPK